MEHPPLRQLHWSDRDLQTTLPAETARALCPKQSAATGIQFWLSLELQRKQFNGDPAQLMLKRFKGTSGAIPANSLGWVYISSSKSSEPRIGKHIAWTISCPARRIHFTMWPDHDLVSGGFAASLPQVTN